MNSRRLIRSPRHSARDASKTVANIACIETDKAIGDKDPYGGLGVKSAG